ncbi:MAG: CoA synthetase [Betaproteobacteria bacterium]|nr:CoA synthetase [Betaproteobacteria bacterium]
MISPCTQTELLISVIAGLLGGCAHVAVGASSPIPGSAAMLARKLAGANLRVSVLGSRKNNFFTNGGVELFDLAAQGRIDAFFLGGGQIDGEGNINLVGSGEYPNTDVRWPGSFGSAYLYYLVPKVILFREEHTPRVMVPKVDFISSPGTSAANVHRPGGPTHLLTGLGLFSFARDKKRFRLESVHPGHTADEIAAQTGFGFDRALPTPQTPLPSAEILRLIRGEIREQVAETYPRFAASAAFGG